MRRLWVVAVSLLVVFPLGSMAQALRTGVFFRGTVLDPSRSPLVAARVTAVPVGTRSPAASTVTNERGEFVLALGVGEYTITVTAQGFLDASQRISPPSTGSEPREFVLELASIRDTVTVSATVGYDIPAISTATKTLTPLRDVPQSVTVITKPLMQDQLMASVADVLRYVPGITMHQGENNRDQVIIRGNSSSADFFINGVRDDVQYYRDLYNLDRVEALKGPNAMIFGRGGGGGVVNRVTKEAGFHPSGEMALQAGTHGNKRVTGDVNRSVSRTMAFRVTGMYERSGSFRDRVTLHRAGLSPTMTIAPSSWTTIKLNYEFLSDTRVADRGIPSYQGRPVAYDIPTFVGDPDQSHVHAGVHLGSATVTHQVGGLTVRNQTLFGHYHRRYQNFVPGAVSADKSQVTLTAYNNATKRKNLFNQTDLTYTVSTGRIHHTLLGGAELGRQLTDNFRNSGFFNDTATSFLIPYTDPTISVPVTFRQSATDAHNRLRTSVAATYAQDQVELSRHVQVLAGLRVDRFDLTYHNNRNGDTLTRTDNLLSPRAGVIVKPIAPLSIYSSYSVSYLPSAGDQFSSLTTITQQVEPGKFTNHEVGAKWDAPSGLSLTVAGYRLDHTNTRATDPNDATRIVQTGRQRTNGYELGVNGRMAPKWTIAGGYAYADAFVASATTAAPTGAQVAQVPRQSFSLWNNYQLHPKVGVGLGVVSRTDMFAGIDNTVTLPGYTRVDTATYVSLTGAARLQLNVENLLNARYYVNADGNTNISPGFPRAIRMGLTTKF